MSFEKHNLDTGTKLMLVKGIGLIEDGMHF